LIQASAFVGNLARSAGVGVTVVNEPRRLKKPAGPATVSTAAAVNATRATKVQRPQEKQAAQGCFAFLGCYDFIAVLLLLWSSLLCFDAVGWAAGRASGL